MLTDLISHFLPEGITEYFDISKIDSTSTEFHIHLSEKNILPPPHSKADYETKDFRPEITIKDFPIRGKEVFLHIKRRRWREKQTKKVIQRDWNLTAEGTRFTKEFACFLKGIA